jgi:putative hydrolase of the HAD superfamily/pyrimidine and pyridine-specific 5'-nucleotidase
MLVLVLVVLVLLVLVVLVLVLVLVVLLLVLLVLLVLLLVVVLPLPTTRTYEISPPQDVRNCDMELFWQMRRGVVLGVVMGVVLAAFYLPPKAGPFPFSPRACVFRLRRTPSPSPEKSPYFTSPTTHKHLLHQSRCPLSSSMSAAVSNRVVRVLSEQLDALKRENAALKGGVQCVFFDCDDCLYQNNWATADKITAGIAQYTKDHLRLPEGVTTYALYKKHGTSAKGLLVEGYLDEKGVKEFLYQAHLIDYCDIKEDLALRQIVNSVKKPRWVFTAAPKEHAERCLARVGIPAELFLGIIDCHACNLQTKHSPASFRVAMEIAGVTDPGACLLCDDSVKNIEAAKRMGWRTVLVGKTDRDNGSPVICKAADVHISSMHELPDAMPELF